MQVNVPTYPFSFFPFRYSSLVWALSEGALRSYVSLLGCPVLRFPERKEEASQNSRRNQQQLKSYSVHTRRCMVTRPRNEPGPLLVMRVSDEAPVELLSSSVTEAASARALHSAVPFYGGSSPRTWGA